MICSLPVLTQNVIVHMFSKLVMDENKVIFFLFLSILTQNSISISKLCGNNMRSWWTGYG